MYSKELCKFLLQVVGVRPTTLLKNRLWSRCFLVNFAKLLRTVFLKSTSGGCFCKLKLVKNPTSSPKQHTKLLQVNTKAIRTVRVIYSKLTTWRSKQCCLNHFNVPIVSFDNIGTFPLLHLLLDLHKFSVSLC